MPLLCRNCGIEIEWQPVIVDRQPYCCLGCTQGGPCQCDYARLPSPGAPTTLAQRGPTQLMEVRVQRPAPLAEAVPRSEGDPLNPAQEVSDGQEGADRRH